MTTGVNIVVLMGNIASDVNFNVRKSPKGEMPVANFSLGVNDGDRSDFPKITLFYKLAESANKYLVKGRRILVEGRLKTGSYTDKDGKTVYTTEVIGNKFTMLDPKKPTQEVAYQEQIEDPEPDIEENESGEF